jgi:hypothetical protein
LRDHTNRVYGVATTVYGGNKVHDVLARSLIVKTVGSGPGEACRRAHGDPLACGGRLKAIHRVTRLGAWPLRGDPTRTREKLEHFSIPR